MKIGDHVKIVAKTHPWVGETGTIVDTFVSVLGPGLDWIVELDPESGGYQGQQVAVGDSDVITEKEDSES